MPDRKAGQFGHRPKTFQHSATSILSSMGRDKGSRGKMPLSGLQKKLTKKERWLLRTGNMPSKAERSIVLLRAKRRGEPDGDEECTEHRSLPYPAGASDASAAPAASAQAAPPPVAETSDRKARLAAAAALGLDGVDEQQQLRRLARVQEQAEDKQERAAAKRLTPAAADLLAQLRSGGI
jgi:hypothetical protein